MTRVISRGTCAFCNRELSKSAMTNHLKTCQRRMVSIEAESSASKKTRKDKLFHLVVEGRYRPMYWMHLEVPASLTLADLDSFLRNIWLECCYHLSAFRIGEVTYHSDAELAADDPVAGMLSSMQSNTPGQLPAEIQAMISEIAPAEDQARFAQFLQSVQEQLGTQTYRPFRRQRSMVPELGQVLEPGIKFTHEYDFGSTTELALKVVAEREGEVRSGKKAIQIMARNEPPVIPCDACGEKPATLIYQGWSDPDSWLCKDCARANHDMNMMLPIPNSPRAGVCGYTGQGSPG